MYNLQSKLQECKKICDKYEMALGGYAPGGLYLQFTDEIINMAFLVASCDGQVDTPEISTINNTFGLMVSYEMLARKYGTDYLSEDSMLHQVPDSIKKVAKAEKEANFGMQGFLDDTRVLCDFAEQFGNIMINCCGARLKYAVMLLEFFIKGVREYIFSVEQQDESFEEMNTIKQERELDKETLFNRNSETNITEINEVLAEVDALVGLQSVKKEIHDMVNLMIVQKMREKSGFKTPDISRHLVFMGNPGTGKTTIARKMAEIFKHLEILGSGHLVETDRSMIVSGQIGETAEKMRQIAESALGGVLFIDEAYSLNSDIEGDYGQEAIETLLKFMEDNRNNVIVIVAGYKDLMDKFLDSNPGLRSRFSKFLSFPDYSEMELMQIFERYCQEQDYTLSESIKPAIIDKIRSMRAINREHFGNARTVRNYFERVVANQANRIVAEIGEGKNQSPEDLMRITAQDL